MIAVVYHGVTFPLLFKQLPRFGNSNTHERVELIERFIHLFGSASLDCLTADREFVGEKWIKYLDNNRIRYYIRIRENFWVMQPHNGKQVKASWLFADLPLNGSRVNHRIVYVNNQLCYLSASKVRNKEGKPELQVVVSFNKPENAMEIYKDRWQIETAFRALKTSGFKFLLLFQKAIVKPFFQDCNLFIGQFCSSVRHKTCCTRITLYTVEYCINFIFCLCILI